MKKLSLFVLLWGLYSCEAISIIKQQKISLNQQEISFDNSANAITVPAEIAHNKTNLLFDTGAMFSCLFEAETLCKEAVSKAIRFGNVWSANRQKLPQNLVVTSVNSPLFMSENKVFASVVRPKPSCAKTQKYWGGVIGLCSSCLENHLGLH